MSDISLHRAMQRRNDTWTVHRTHTEDEQAFLDRSLMATEIDRLRQALADTQDALAEANREIDGVLHDFERVAGS